MKDEHETKEQLTEELVALRQRIAELEVLEAERKQAEEALRIKDNAIASSITAIAIAEFAGNLTYVNNSFLKMWGYDDENEVLGRRAVDLWQVAEKAWGVIEALRDEGSFTGELVAKRKDGSLFDVQLSASVVTDEASEPVCMMASFVDITGRKWVEEALKASEEYTRNIIESSPDMVIACDLERRIVEFNKAAEEIFGYCREEVVGKHVDILYADPQESLIVHKTTIKEGKCVREILDRRKSGEVFPAFLSASVLRDVNGEIVGVMGVARDITEQKRAEEALKASQEYIRNLIDSSLDTIIAVDLSRHIVEFNKAAEETFGYCREEVVGKHVDMLYADPRQGLKLHQETIEKGKCVQEILSLRKNGETFPTFLSASVLRDSRGELVGVMGVSRDITEQKRAEEELKRRNQELALLNRASQALISTLDLGQVLVTVLEEVQRLLNVVAGSVWLADPETDELVCHHVIGPQSEIVRGWRLAPDEGLAGWVARSGESLIVPDAQADVRHFKGVDRQIGLEFRSILTAPLRVKKGVIGVLQLVDTEADRFSPADLRLIESLAMTAAIAIENARLYEQAQRDAETRAVLLSEVNHRVKNNLSTLIGLLHAERRYIGVGAQAMYQSIMQNLVNRVQGLATVHSLLSASEWAPLLLSELTTQVVRSSLQMLPRDKRVSVEVTPSPVRVMPDQAHNLALVINELTTNTITHALPERDTGRVTVRISVEDDTVLFEFQDDGPGYSGEVLQLERYGVGFDLIQNIVHKNLHGELSLRNDHGAVAVVRFKAET